MVQVARFAHSGPAKAGPLTKRYVYKACIVFNQDDYFRIFGRISILFATLDFGVTELILKIAKAEGDDFKLPHNTATLGNKLRFLQSSSVSSAYALEIKNSLSSILPKAVAIADERNRYIHDIWIFNPNTITSGKIDRIQLSSTGLKERVSLSIEEIQAFENDIGYIQQYFFEPLIK
ncbi:hypothetical protein [Pseudomonas anguilliseptica]|uniref:hypothetical protein n=1 Tax=Pseudomonas anguilliseptica TaxID=53406 RepID=UPI0037355AF9